MPSWKKIIVSGSAGSLLALSVSTHITASGHVSASSTSTGSFGAVNVAGMSVSNLVDVSSSFSTRVLNLKTDSGSFSTRVTRNEATGSSLTTASSSFSTRVSNLKTDSGSFSTRVSTEESNVDTLQSTMTSEQTNIDNLQTDSGSFSTRVSNLKSDSGSYSTRVSNLKSDSGSFSTRVSTEESNVDSLQTDSGSFSTRVSNLKSDSGSFSTRVTTNEGDLTTLKGSGTAQGVGQSNSPTFVNVTATGNITAQEFHTEFVSSSIVYRSGSTKFGDTIDDIHSFTGSIHQSGSFNLNDGNMTIADTLTATTLTGTTIKDFSTISGSATSTGSFGRTSTATLDLDSIQGNWTNAGNTVADLGSITTVDINGGTINGITDLAVADGGTGASSLNNLITLTTHTTGNYVATITGGTNLTSTAATSGEGTTHTLNVDDAFLINNGNDTTSGTITAAGLITSGNVSGSIISTGSFGRLEAIIGPFFELDGDGDIMPL